MRTILTIMLFVTASYLTGCKDDQKKPDNKDSEKMSSSSTDDTTDDCCKKLNTYVDEYFKKRIQLAKSRDPEKNSAIMIDTAVGNAYIDAYKLSLSNIDRTHGIILDVRTVAFLYKYLTDHPNENIGLSLARYSDKYFKVDGRNATDDNLGKPENARKLNGLALVIGPYKDDKLSYFSTAKGVFYDDWNQEWP